MKGSLQMTTGNISLTTHKDEKRSVDLEELLKEHDLSGVFRTPNCNQRV